MFEVNKKVIEWPALEVIVIDFRRQIVNVSFSLAPMSYCEVSPTGPAILALNLRPELSLTVFDSFLRSQLFGKFEPGLPMRSIADSLA